MPIEFHCTGCGKLLRTADETAGRGARCPACGTVMSVPERPAAPQEVAAPTPPEVNPFGPTESMDDFDDEINPYQAPVDTTSASAFASDVPPIERVRGPAISLIVMGSMGLVMYVCFTAFICFTFFMVINEGHHADDALVVLVMYIGAGLLGIVTAILSIFGGVKMKNLEGYGLAVTASIIMLIPCFSPCGILGIPFGIWALVVLLNSDIRNAFR